MVGPPPATEGPGTGPSPSSFCMARKPSAAAVDATCGPSTNRPSSRRARRSRSEACATVVIPALNEARTIASVVRFALRDPWVREVLVIDDGSVDDTADLATRAGARVVASSMLGKGISMQDGLAEASTEFVVYLDADLKGLRRAMLRALIEPLRSGEADFVKARFSRAAGRVTALTAKPLLRLYFPELSHLHQPLGGIVAARRDVLRQLRFENDYGVDVGLVIDAIKAGARVAEVDIGRITHDSQSLEALSEMACQVSRVILERAAEWGRLRLSFMRHQHEINRRQAALRPVGLRRLHGARGLALIDMDGTLLDGRFVAALGEATGRTAALSDLLDHATMDPVRRTRRIAALFKGVPKSTFEQVARSLPLMPGAIELVVGLRRRGFVVGIVTDSYRIAAETVRLRVFADFSLSHVMAFRRETATGRVTLCPFMSHQGGCEEHAICKHNVLLHLLEESGIPPSATLAVGDGENDRCLLARAGRSFAFNPKSQVVAKSARHVVRDNLRAILDLLPPGFP